MWAAGIALVVLVGLPAVLSVPGDKQQVIIPVPGPVRFMLEVELGLAGVIAAWYVRPVTAALTATLIVVTAQITGVRRSQLAAGGGTTALVRHTTW